MKDLISIIVPVYNAEKYLNKCLDSLINQTIKNIELILVNDNSKDHSKEICKEYAEGDKRIHLVDTKGLGVSLARQLGFLNAKGEYIMFVDSDDWLELDACAYLLNLLKSNKSDVACINYCYNDDLVKCKEEITTLTDKNIIVDYFNNSNIKSCLWNKIYKKKVIKKEFFCKSVNYAEDSLFNVYVLTNIKKLTYSNQQKYHYYILNSSASRKKPTVRMINDGFNSHEMQTKIVLKKYPKDTNLVNSLYDKTVDTAIDFYNKLSMSDISNENFKCLKENVKKIYSNKYNLSKTKKLKLFMILYFPRIYKIIHTILKDKILLYSTIFSLLAVIIIIGFIFGFNKYDNNNRIKMLVEAEKLLNNANETVEINRNNSYFEHGEILIKDDKKQMIAFRNGYCLIKFFENEQFNVTTSSSENCVYINSDWIKSYAIGSLANLDLDKMAIFGYKVYAKKKVNSYTYIGLEEDIGSEKNIILEDGNKRISINFDEPIRNLNGVADYVNYDKQAIIRQIGVTKLTSETKIVKTKHNGLDTFKINNKIYVLVENTDVKTVSELKNIIKEQEDLGQNLNLYYLLEKTVEEPIVLPELKLDYKNLKTTNENDIVLEFYNK